MFASPVMAAAVGATDTKDCYNDENDYVINPEVVLCNTHAYNVGLVKNPEESANQEAMAKVVALKANIITQQMKKQYDYMDATMKRFRIQLEKSVMMAKLEAAGATPSKSGSSGAATRGIAGAGKCNRELTKEDVLKCLRQNLALMRGMSDDGKQGSSQLIFQIEEDIKVAKEYCTTKATALDETCESSVVRNKNGRDNCLAAISRCLEEIDGSIKDDAGRRNNPFYQPPKSQQ